MMGPPVSAWGKPRGMPGSNPRISITTRRASEAAVRTIRVDRHIVWRVADQHFGQLAPQQRLHKPMAEHIRAGGSRREISADLDDCQQDPDERGFCLSCPPWSSNPKQSSTTVPGVIREIEIWRVAVLMVNRYADEAEANSFMRAEELAAEGDQAGAAIWRRVTVAIEQLTDTTGPTN